MFVFDFDGTLANTLPMWKNIIDAEVFKEYNVDYDKEYM